MSKDHDARKNVKKKALKTIKEKRREKKAKQADATAIRFPVF